MPPSRATESVLAPMKGDGEMRQWERMIYVREGHSILGRAEHQPFPPTFAP